MNLDEFLEVFNDQTMRTVFEKIVSEHRISYHEILESLEIDSELSRTPRHRCGA